MIRLEPWGTGDLPLLEQCVGDPAMMDHLGGPQNPEEIARRQARYEQPWSKQFKIVDEATGEGVGWVGYWEREEDYETGWAVIPAFQSRGIASSATRELVAIAAAERTRRYLWAYPSVDNAPSNAVCRKVGFTLIGSSEYEYPKGHPMVCNDWRLELFADS